MSLIPTPRRLAPGTPKPKGGQARLDAVNSRLLTFIRLQPLPGVLAPLTH